MVLHLFMVVAGNFVRESFCAIHWFGHAPLVDEPTSPIKKRWRLKKTPNQC